MIEVYNNHGYLPHFPTPQYPRYYLSHLANCFLNTSFCLIQPNIYTKTLNRTTWKLYTTDATSSIVCIPRNIPTV